MSALNDGFQTQRAELQRVRVSIDREKEGMAQQQRELEHRKSALDAMQRRHDLQATEAIKERDRVEKAREKIDVERGLIEEERQREQQWRQAESEWVEWKKEILDKLGMP